MGSLHAKSDYIYYGMRYLFLEKIMKIAISFPEEWLKSSFLNGLHQKAHKMLRSAAKFNINR